MNFSVVVIARNELKTLPRLLTSLEGFQKNGGEIVVVDTGSTDGTPAMARGRGCKVIEVGDKFVFKIDSGALVKEINTHFGVEDDPIVAVGDSTFDFAAARNFAAELAACDMIAMPDCDEIYTCLNFDVINHMIASGVDQLHYNFVFSHTADGRRELQFRHSKFYNRKKMRWHGVTHEILKPSTQPIAESFVGEDTILLEHFQNHETPRGQYMKGLAVDCFRNQDNDRNAHYLARELYYTGRYKSAIKLFERHVEMPSWQPERARSMLFIGDCHQFLGDMKSALTWWHRSFDEFASREPLIRLADHYFKQKDFSRTAAYAAAATTVPKPDAYFVQAAHYGAYPYHLLYWAHYWMGEKEDAKFYLDACLRIEPDNARFIEDMAIFFPEQTQAAAMSSQ